MNKKLITILLIVTMLFTLSPAAAMADVVATAPDVNATSYIVVDGETGEVLFGKNYQQQCAPASITKIMTAMLAIESGKLDTEVTVPELPEYIPGAVTIHLAKGEKYTLRSLVQVMLVASANDAADVIANAVGGSTGKFVEEMNAKAQALGMTGTTFKNANGLDEDGHLVTAEDMAKLACYAMKNETFREMVLVQQVDWKGISYEKPLPTTNQLFSIMPEATGIKTGNSNNAGRTLVGSAKRENRELIGVILGAPDESVFKSMKNVLEYGFEHTKLVPVIQKDSLQTTLQFGEDTQVRVVAGEDYSIIQSTDNASIVNYQTKLTNVELPIKKDSQVGVMEVLVDDTVVHEVPLLAMDDAKKPINWVFVVALFLAIVYIASICSRIVTNVRKSQRKKNAKKAAAAQRNSAKSARDSQYDQLMSTVEHPTQTAKTNRKVLTSSRDRNNNRR